MKTRIILILTVFLVALICLCFIQENRLKMAKNEAERQRSNTEALLSDITQYRTRDSLSAAKATTLELRVKEFEKYRDEDAELIRTLKVKNRELSSVNQTQAATIIELSSKPSDTVVIIHDSIQVPAVAVHSGDPWYDFNGYLTEDAFTGTLVSRDSIVVVETIKRKRFLWWKTKKIKNRQVDVVSRNPHTTIMNVENLKIVD